MKKTAFFLFATVLALTVSAQEIHVNASTIETGVRDKQTGNFNYAVVQSTKSTVMVNDSVVSVTDDLGGVTEYRVFKGQTPIADQLEISERHGMVEFSVINDKTGEIFTASVMPGEFGEVNVFLSNTYKSIVFRGK